MQKPVDTIKKNYIPIYVLLDQPEIRYREMKEMIDYYNLTDELSAQILSLPIYWKSIVLLVNYLFTSSLPNVGKSKSLYQLGRQMGKTHGTDLVVRASVAIYAEIVSQVDQDSLTDALKGWAKQFESGEHRAIASENVEVSLRKLSKRRQHVDRFNKRTNKTPVNNLVTGLIGRI